MTTSVRPEPSGTPGSAAGTATDLWDREAADTAGSPPGQSAGDARPANRPAGESPPNGRRRWLWVAALAVAVVIVALLLVTSGPGPATSTPLDPNNPSANGAQALARVLESHGIKVDVARNAAEVGRANPGADTTVFVARPSELAPSTARDLADATRGAARLVLLAPDRTVVRVLSPDTTVTETRRSETDLATDACGTTDVRAGETLSRSQADYQSRVGAIGCFTKDGRSVYVSLPKTTTTAPLVLLGSSTVVANDQITSASNAAIALRMLGHTSRVLWYIPTRDDVPSGQTGPASLIPRWIGPALVLGGVAFLGLVLWRGRRFGRLVPEPLPVVVRAVETTESRGRLYRRARDASRAGLVLQQATRTRLADYLGLPRPSLAISSRGADQALVAAVADATGRPRDQVGSVLLGPPPTRDDHLLGLAAELAALEKEVRHQ